MASTTWPVGTPFEDSPTLANAGLVQVLGGSSSGIDLSVLHQNWRLGNSGVGLSQQANALFGSALESGNFDGDSSGAPDYHPEVDLAIGVPGLTDSGTSNAGGVVVLGGSSTGLSSSKSLRLMRGDPGLSGDVLSADMGASLAVGDFDGDGFDDLAVGAPFDSPKIAGVTYAFAGTVQYFLGNVSRRP